MFKSGRWSLFRNSTMTTSRMDDDALPPSSTLSLSLSFAASLSLEPQCGKEGEREIELCFVRRRTERSTRRRAKLLFLAREKEREKTKVRRKCRLSKSLHNSAIAIKKENFDENKNTRSVSLFFFVARSNLHGCRVRCRGRPRAVRSRARRTIKKEETDFEKKRHFDFDVAQSRKSSSFFFRPPPPPVSHFLLRHPPETKKTAPPSRPSSSPLPHPQQQQTPLRGWRARTSPTPAATRGFCSGTGPMPTSMRRPTSAAWRSLVRRSRRRHGRNGPRWRW